MGSSIRATATTSIARGVDEVFASVSDFEAMGEWVDGVSNVRFVSGDGDGVGDVYEYDYEYNGRTTRVRVEITTFEPPTRLAMSAREGPFPFESELRLAGDSRETRLTHTVEPGADGRFTAALFTLLGPLMRRLAERRLDDELTELKEILESRESSEVSARPADSEQSASP